MKTFQERYFFLAFGLFLRRGGLSVQPGYPATGGGLGLGCFAGSSFDDGRSIYSPHTTTDGAKVLQKRETRGVRSSKKMRETLR